MAATTTRHTAFWQDLPINVHEQLLECMDEPTLNTAVASAPGPRTTPEEKLLLLETYITTLLQTLKSTTPYPEEKIEDLIHARGLVAWTNRRDVAITEATWRELIALRPASRPNLAALSNLAGMLLTDERVPPRLDEAEGIFRLLVPLLQPREGKATPQGLGAIRGLAEIAIKRGGVGDRVRAKALLDEAQGFVNGLGEGGLKKEEQEAVDELRALLK